MRGSSDEADGLLCAQLACPEAGLVRLEFIASQERTEAQSLLPVLEDLERAGAEMGLTNTLAELALDSDYLGQFLKAGFRIWDRQRVFRYPMPTTGGNEAKLWHPWRANDMGAVSRLHRELQPPHSCEPFSRGKELGWVAYAPGGTLLAFADCMSGSHGLWVRISLRAETCTEALVLDLLSALRGYPTRHIYLPARNSQGWLGALFEVLDLGCSEEVALLQRPSLARVPLKEYSFERLLDATAAENVRPSIHSTPGDGQ